MRILCLLFLCSVTLVAQEKYSYLTDRKFEDVNSIIGYNFVPSKLEKPGGDADDLAAGDYSFGVTNANLFISGGELDGVFNINNMVPEKYGYKISTMNARNPMEQGYLKLILDGDSYINALIYKEHRNADQIIFYLPDKTKEQIEVEKAFYTEDNELYVSVADSIWGTKVKPYFRTSIQNRQQERLWMEDSTQFKFVQEIEVETNEKKRSKNPEEYDRLSALRPEELVTEDRKLVKKLGFSIKQKNTIYMKSRVVFEDGKTELVEEEFEVKEMAEYEDEAAGKMEDKYMIQMETNKGPFLIYVLGDRTVSGIEFRAMTFEMMH